MEKLWSRIVDIFRDIPSFIENNYANPFFWVILLALVALVSFFGINKLGDK